MPLSSWLLAFNSSANKSNRLPGEIIPWLIVLIAAVLAGGVVVFAIRRWLRGDQRTSEVGFTLQEMRDLHAAGELSDEEFERVKTQMIGRLKTSARVPPDPSTGASPGNSTS